jgi:cephalosporin hydroxylase
MENSIQDTLLEYFERSDHRLIHKWMHYFDIYERHLHAYRGKPVSLLEFGVYHGGSLQMWKHYLGPEAEIYGVDIDPRCANLGEDQITILMGDQSNREFLRSIKKALPKFDIVIDDGGHTMTQQIVTFEEIFAHLNDGGVYLAEDLHTSYIPAYGGGLRDPGSFIEYSKRLIDQLNAWHSTQPGFGIDGFTNSAFAMHYYDSVLVIEKRAMSASRHRMKGKPSFPLEAAELDVYRKG